MSEGRVDVSLDVNEISEGESEEGPGFFSISLHSNSKDKIISNSKLDR